MIVLTGASGGLGKEVVRNLGAHNNILAIYKSNKPNVKQYNSNVEWMHADLLLDSDIKKVCEKVESYREKVTLVNMSAIKRDGLLIDYDPSTWRHVFEVNVTSVFSLIKGILPIMMNDLWGRVILITSTGGVRGDIGTVSYSASKNALFGLSNVLGKEYARYNVTSNILSLGTFDTGLFHELNDKLRSDILKGVPSKKTGEISDIAKAIELIISSEYINRSVINIDGGM
jgi:3-oxoacyl-[acyl-carrier protein] reductase